MNNPRYQLNTYDPYSNVKYVAILIDGPNGIFEFLSTTTNTKPIKHDTNKFRNDSPIPRYKPTIKNSLISPPPIPSFFATSSNNKVIPNIKPLTTKPPSSPVFSCSSKGSPIKKHVKNQTTIPLTIYPSGISYVLKSTIDNPNKIHTKHKYLRHKTLNPNRFTMPINKHPSNTSPNKQLLGILFPQFEHLPLFHTYETIGIKSFAPNSCPQESHFECP